MNPETVKMMNSDRFDEDFWLFQLGLIESDSKDGQIDLDKRFIYSFYEQGQHLWVKYRKVIQQAFCDMESMEPNQKMKVLLEGEARNLIDYMLGIFLALHGVNEALAIPLIALTLKKGINNFCEKDF